MTWERAGIMAGQLKHKLQSKGDHHNPDPDFTPPADRHGRVACDLLARHTRHRSAPSL